MDYFQEYSVLFLLNFSFIARQSYLETLSIAQFLWQNKSVRWAVPLDFQTKTRQLGYLGICFHTAEVGGGACIPFPARKNAAPKPSQKTQLPNHPSTAAHPADTAWVSREVTVPQVCHTGQRCCQVPMGLCFSLPQRLVLLCPRFSLVLMETWSFKFLAFCFKTAFF